MIRFLVFSDLHYDDTPDGDKRLAEILTKAHSRQLDFIVSLGDLCDPSPENREILDKFLSLGLPFYPVIGNHETDEHSLSEITDFYSLNAPYYSVIHGDYKLIFMNTCYLLKSNTEQPYFKRNFKHDAVEYPIVPADEINWLKNELDCEMKCIIFSHHSFVNEFAKRGVSNKSVIQKLFRQNSVPLCLNGHDHGDNFSCIGDTSYMTINSANYAWLGAQIASSETLKAKYSYLHGMLQYTTAMSAYVEADEHEIRIFGEEGSYLSVTPDDIALHDYKWNGVSIKPQISSHRVRVGNY